MRPLPMLLIVFIVDFIQISMSVDSVALHSKTKREVRNPTVRLDLMHTVIV